MPKPAISIEVTGLPELREYLDKKKSDFDEATIKALTTAGFYVEGKVKSSIGGFEAEDASVDTGNMRRMVSAGQVQNGEIAVTGGAEYTQYIEYGTSRFLPGEGRGHFRNTAAREESKVRDIIALEIKRS